MIRKEGPQDYFPPADEVAAALGAKLTKWSKPGQLPFREGVYNASYQSHNAAAFRKFKRGDWYFAGKTPEQAAQETRRCYAATSRQIIWRGLTRDFS